MIANWIRFIRQLFCKLGALRGLQERIIGSGKIERGGLLAVSVSIANKQFSYSYIVTLALALKISFPVDTTARAEY